MVYVLPFRAEQFEKPLSATAGSEIVLIKQGDQITHIGKGTRKSGSIVLAQVRPLSKPIHIMRLPAMVPNRLKAHAIRIFNSGGALPLKTGEAVIDGIVFVEPGLAEYVR